MPKVGSRDLFHLVQSLSKSEKRYLKLALQAMARGKELVYITLFDAIETQSASVGEYDEQAILKQERSIQHKQLSNLKSYLYDFILDTMRVFWAGRTVESKLKNLLEDAWYVYDKQLISQCTEVLKKAEKLAFEFEKFAYLFEIFRLKRLLIFSGSDLRNAEKELKEMQAVKKSALQNLENLNEYQSLSVDLFILTKQKNKIAGGKNFLKTPVLRNIHKASSHEAKIHYYNLKSSYNRLIGNFNTAYEEAKACIAVFERSPEFIKESLEGYVALISNALNLALRAKKHKECLELASKLKGVTENNSYRITPKTRIILMARYYNFYFDFYVQQGLFEKALQLVPEVQEFIVDSKEKISPESRLLFEFNFGYFFFVVGNYKKSLYWLSKVLNEPDKKLRQDIQDLSKLLFLMVHFELENYELIDQTIRSAAFNKYVAVKKISRSEDIAIHFFKKVLKAFENHDLKNHLKDFQKQLNFISKPEEESSITRDVDLQTWVNCKVAHTNFSEAMRKNAEESSPHQYNMAD